MYHSLVSTSGPSVVLHDINKLKNDVALDAQGNILVADRENYRVVVTPLAAYPLGHITQMWSVWMTLLITWTSFIAVCKPFQASRFCTIKR